MLRNRRSRNDFMGMDNSYREPMMQPMPPVSQLDAQSERLAEQAEDIGWLKGQNDMLNEDNRRLEQENQKLRESNKTVTEDAQSDRRLVSALISERDALKETIDKLTAKKGTK